MRVLLLTLDPGLQGPLPKLAPLITSSLEKLNCQVIRSTWGRHSEHEYVIKKLFDRVQDIRIAIGYLIIKRPDILFVETTLDEFALLRDVLLLITTFFSPAKTVLKMNGSKTSSLVGHGHNVYKILTRILIHLSDAILLLSIEEMDKWRDFEPRGNYYHIDNPFSIERDVDLPKWNVNTTSSDPILLFVGRLIREKGIYELIDSMPDIMRKIKCQLFVVGDGEEKDEIFKRIEMLNLNQSIKLLGYLDSKSLEKIYLMSSIFILPSYREGFPTALAEAMSYGLPIITTPVGGIPDHLNANINAIFIKPKDSEEISNAILRLLSNQKLRREMHEANLQKIKEFAPDIVVPKYIEIFKHLLGTT